jgi:potassium-dependent mechanosensitive channel
MKRLLIFSALIFTGFSILAQSAQKQNSSENHNQSKFRVVSDSLNSKTESENEISSSTKKLILAKDTLTTSDYMMSIDRVNDNLNSIIDSSNLRFEVLGMGRRITAITGEILTIRKNVRGRSSTFNVRSLYLYQNFASQLNDENDKYEENVAKIYHRVYTSKLSLKTAMTDSVFRVLYSDGSLHKTFAKRLVRLERKWARTDSTTKANIDTLNALKIKIADNAVSLSNMLNIIDNRLDKADQQLFGNEMNFIWQKPKNITKSGVASNNAVTKLVSERNSIGFYLNETSKQRTLVLILGLLLLIWLFFKRKLLKAIREPGGPFSFLHFQYLNNSPVLSVLVLLMCLMPFFDAYAPTSYMAIEYFLLLAITSAVLFRNENQLFRLIWMILVALFVADILTYLFIEPTFLSRLWLLIVHASIIVFSYLFYKKVNKNVPYFKLIKYAAITSIILSISGIISNLFGRFSLSGIFGLSAIFAVTQAVVLTVFIEIIVEIILLQLQSSRISKGFNTPFDRSIIIKKIKTPLIIVAMILWLIMLTSNLNIYHNLKISAIDWLTTPRSIGSISFELVSVLYFFIIIWFTHIIQQLISFLFGETGIENENLTPVSKKQHSRLLITRLLVLVGGYLLAIAASGLPIDKLTILLGALGIGIGMGLQNIVSNFVSGIILIFDGSLKIGDEIEISGQSGKVKEIGLRASKLTTSDGADVIIPNGNITSQNIVNWTFSNDNKRVKIWFILSGKELDSNVINEVINDTIKNIPGVNSQKKPVILYTRVTPDNCTLTVHFWTTINNADNVKSDSYLQLSSAFASKQIQFE